MLVCFLWDSRRPRVPSASIVQRFNLAIQSSCFSAIQHGFAWVIIPPSHPILFSFCLFPSLQLVFASCWNWGFWLINKDLPAMDVIIFNWSLAGCSGSPLEILGTKASISARQPVSYCNFPYLIHLGCIVKPVLPFYRRFLWDSFRQWYPSVTFSGSR